VAHTRQTFWGEDWSVKNTPNPTNLSLTSLELKCHTDFVWSEFVPGVQFLHCIRNAGPTGGGETVLVDGYKAALLLKEQDPDAFRLLSTQAVPWYFKTKNLDYSYRGCVIELDENQQVKRLRYNQANRGPLEGPPHIIPQLYRAIQKFATLIRSPDLTKQFLLNPGDVLVFNNTRALHGRAAFDARAERFLEGCYLDLEEVTCRRTVLMKQLHPTTSNAITQTETKISKPRIPPRILSITSSSRTYRPTISVPLMFSSSKLVSNTSMRQRQARNFSRNHLNYFTGLPETEL